MESSSKKVLMVALAMAAGLSSTAEAAAVRRSFSGQACNPQTSSDVGRLQYTQFGVHNNDTSSRAFVGCGATMDYGTSRSVNQINLWYYDRSSTDDVCCTFLVQDNSGNALGSIDQCGFGNQAAAGVLTASFFGSVSGQVANVLCRIPAKTSSGLSHVASYEVFML